MPGPVTRILLLSLSLCLLGMPAMAGPAPDRALILEINDAIGPATADYVVRGIDKANDGNYPLVILRMDTPGGLDTAMRDIIKAILASSVPVAVYVAPQGSRAASAGTYILYASHIAAMAPATNLGAATPVSIGGGGGAPVSAPPEEPVDAEDKQKEAPADTTAMERKAVNDAVAYIRSLAEKRGRNADWAEQAVREAVSLSAEEALKKNVIDVLAENVPDLLRQIDGRSVSTSAGTLTLETASLETEIEQADWRTELLGIVTNPTVAYLLMLLGIYGLLFEGYNPGAIVPGVVGAICLLLALYAFQVLPVNYAGLALIALGVVLMIAEAFAPSFGALGLGGIAAFVFGSIILMKTDVPGYGIPVPIIASIAGVGGVLVLGLMWFVAKSRNTRIVSGREEMIGAIAIAQRDFEETGLVRAHSENWHAASREPVRKGQKLKVIGIDGLTLRVEPFEDDSSQGHSPQKNSQEKSS